MKGTSAAAAILIFGLLLTACTEGVYVPNGWEDLPPCPPQEIPAEDLAAIGSPGCNLEGSTVIFPDGTHQPIVEVGAVSIHQFVPFEGDPGDEYSVTNWGIPGVAATQTAQDGTRSMWATSEEARHLESK